MMREIITKDDKPGKFLVGLFTILFLLILAPYAMPLFWALILAILLRPAWNLLDRSFKGKRVLKGLTMVLLVVLLLIIPFVLILLALPGQINTLMQVLPQYKAAFLGLINDGLALLPPNLATELQSTLTNSAKSSMGSISQAAVNLVTSAATSMASFFFQATLMLFVLYYFFTDGPRIYAKTVEYLPFSDELIARLKDRFVAITNATVGGVFVIAIAQGTVGAIVYWLFGVNAAMGLGLATMVASFIPAVGSGLVWIPVAIFLALNGEVGKGILMIAAGVLIIANVDNLLRPKLVGSKTQIPDFLVLLTTLGGLSLLGTAGIVLGPMVAGMCIALWKMTKPESDEAAVSATVAANPVTTGSAAGRKRKTPKT